MPTILKSVNFEFEHSVQVGTRQPDSARRPKAHASTEPAGPDGAGDGPSSEAHDALDQAEKQVEMMLDQAKSRIAVWQKEAQQSGWQTGYEEAQRAVAVEMADALAAARELAESAVESRELFLRKSQSELSRLAVAIAEKIIGHELTTQSTTIGDIVTHVIDVASVRQACVIRVSQEDYEILRDHWSKITAGQPPDAPWDLVADRRVGRGGCLIEADGGHIDARLETQMKQVEMALDTVGH